MNQLEVHIMGQSYVLTCPPEGESQLRDAASRVDSVMCRIRDAGKARVRDRIAVLAALNLAFELAQSDLPGTQFKKDPYRLETEENLERNRVSEAVMQAVLQRLDSALAMAIPASAIDFSSLSHNRLR